MSEKGPVELGPNHVPGIRVPKGGSSCASCEYLGSGGRSCTNKYFIKWNGSPKLPFPADEYCSDWYEPKEKLGERPVRSPHGFPPLKKG